MNYIAFTKVRLPYGWLGNMSPFPLVYLGEAWRTSEALFQALRFEDSDIRTLIRVQTSPMAAKMVAKQRRAAMTVDPQGPLDVVHMRRVVALKVAQHPQLEADLIATGDAPIYEDCTKRQRGSGLFWGAALVDGVWQGWNMLGRIWMDLRHAAVA